MDFRSSELDGIAQNFVNDNDLKYTGTPNAAGESINRDSGADRINLIGD